MNWILELTLSIIGLLPVSYLLTNAYLSRRRARNVRVPAAAPSEITVVIPVYCEEPDRFRATLESVGHRGSRVLVVGDGCVEPYRALAADAGAEFLPLAPRGGKKRALAAGLERVATPFVLFVDSDTVLPERAAERLSTYFAPGVGGVGANLLHQESNSIAAGCAEFVERAREVVLRAMSSRGNVLYLDGACMMFRTELVRPFVASEEFQHLRVFGRETPLGDDWQLTDFVLSRGLRTVKAYDVGAITRAPETMGGFVRQNTRWMRSSWIRLGRYLKGAGPQDPGLFYRLELIGTYALPLLTFALAIARLPLFVHVFDSMTVRFSNLLGHGLAISKASITSVAWRHLIFPAQAAAGALGTFAFVGAVADRLPRHRRLRTLACGLLGSGLLLLSTLYGLVTVWRASPWREGPSGSTAPTGSSPVATGAWSGRGRPLLRR